jgi:elongation factor 1-gamma
MNFFEDKFDANGVSFWLLHYQKYDKSEGDRLHFTANLLNGFMQRMDEKVRNHSLGVFGIYGEEPDLEQMGLFLWRGTELPQPMVEHPQFEYWNKKKMDVKNEGDCQLIIDYLTTKEGQITLDGKKAQKVIYYK